MAETPAPTTPFFHMAHGRNRRSISALVFMVCLMIALYMIDTVLWILLGLCLFTLPAFLDVLINPTSTLEINDQFLRWKNRGQEAEVPLDQIEKIRFDGRLDLSVRVVVVLQDQTKLRLPYDVLPAIARLEKVFQDRAVRTERHPFTLL